MEVLSVYVGKDLVKMDLGKLLEIDVEVWDKLTYQAAKKHQDLIPAIEITIEDCLGTVVNIVDEASFKLAVADLVNIIHSDNEINNNEEEEVMFVNENMKAAVDEMLNKIDGTKEDLKVKAGETKDAYMGRAEGSLNVLHAGLVNLLDKVTAIIGYDTIKQDVLAIMEAGTDGKSSKKSIQKMAMKCIDRIEEEIDFLMSCGDEESFKKAVQLQALVEGGRTKSVFEAFAAGVIWIGKKVTRKLREWCQVDEEKSIFGAICRSLSGLASFLREGAKLVWNTAKFAVSFVIAGAIKFVDWVFRAIGTVIDKIKAWWTNRSKNITTKEVLDDTQYDAMENFYEQYEA